MLAGLERGVELNERLRPQHARLHLLIDVRADPVVADGDEATDVAGILTDDPLSEIEDVTLAPLTSRILHAPHPS